MALQKEKSRFQKGLTLGEFLCHVQPANNVYLKYRLIVPPDVTFAGTEYKSDDEQCFARLPKRQRHGVKTGCDRFVRRAATGTSLVDGYMNLMLRPEKSGLTWHTTLFVQYKHSTVPLTSSSVKVSEMNADIDALHETLVAMEWETTRHWLLLWVTNRNIQLDAEPRERLLWVGQDDLEKHVPLIGRRGLVIEE